jgi:hypothetical protein
MLIVSISVRGEDMPRIMMNIARDRNARVGDLVYEALIAKYGEEISRYSSFFSSRVDSGQHNNIPVNNLSDRTPDDAAPDESGAKAQ